MNLQVKTMVNYKFKTSNRSKYVEIFSFLDKRVIFLGY
jgi:hypothetical protein